MSIVITGITVPEAATIINVIITVLQYTLGLALVALLLYLLPASNSANSWSVAARQVHMSLWPIILRCAPSNASFRIEFFSKLSFISALLVAICGVVTPLGLKQGRMVPSKYHTVDAPFIEDTSPLGLATSPRQDFKYGRYCGGLERVVCPGNTPDTINSTDIPPSILEIFSSTPHGPFNMQFRRYYISRDNNLPVTMAQIGVVESMVLRDGIFAAAGLMIDMSDSPGVGFLNHTAPLSKEGATWSQETLWLEPVTTCVNTNLTIDYVLTEDFNIFRIPNFNLTDRGGFVNLTRERPTLSFDGQNINLYKHAYSGAVYSNFYTMKAFNNMTREESYIGKAYPLNSTSASFRVGEMSTMNLAYLSNVTLSQSEIQMACKGFGGGDVSGLSNVAVHCGLFAGPARRTDGGDERVPSIDSRWSQTLHVCASATRASIQTVTLTSNSTRDLSKLQIVRKPSDKSVLWAMENTNMTIGNINPFWGRVMDKYESDSSLSTVRSNALYLPAGTVDIIGAVLSGQPSTVPGAAWSQVYAATSNMDDLDYSGKSNYAVLTKWQTLLAGNPELGHAQIRNRIWTDIVANSLVGLETHPKLVAATLRPSVGYDLRYGIPLLIAFIIWVPSCVASVLVLLLGLLKVSHIRNIINHTKVGRLALGHSALNMENSAGSTKDSEPINPNESEWQKTTGRTTIPFRPIVDVQRTGNEALYSGLADRTRDFEQ